MRSKVSAKTPATGCPLERPTQVVGSGKTRFTAAFFMPDVTHSRRPGALIVFKEREADRKANVVSFGFNLAGLG